MEGVLKEIRSISFTYKGVEFEILVDHGNLHIKACIINTPLEYSEIVNNCKHIDNLVMAKIESICTTMNRVKEKKYGTDS